MLPPPLACVCRLLELGVGLHDYGMSSFHNLCRRPAVPEKVQLKHFVIPMIEL